MSVQTTNNYISKTDKEISKFEKQLADEAKKEFNNYNKINQIKKTISKNTSLSQLQAKQNQIIRYQNEINKILKKKASLSKKIIDKRDQRRRYEKQLDREIKIELRRQEQIVKGRRQEELRYRQQITNELQRQKQGTSELGKEPKKLIQKEYDFFISHATEDKESFVRPLAERLTELEMNIWYDEFQLKVGDSLRRSIDNGLKNSKYGIVVLSNSFFSKNWTQYELDGLVTKEMNGIKVILPIWHKVSKDDVISYSPTLADKVALNTSLMSIDEIVNELKKLLET